MFLKPAPGLKVRDPIKKDLLPEGGREVTESLYWHRRLRDRDVVEASPPADQAAAETAPAANAVRKGAVAQPEPAKAPDTAS